jgi:hypothetical protein
VADQDAWLCFEDEAGQTLRPPKACTWRRRGAPQVMAEDNADILVRVNTNLVHPCS